MSKPPTERARVLAYIVAHPGLRREALMTGLKKQPNATSRLLADLQRMGAIKSRGLSRATTWYAVDCPVLRALPNVWELRQVRQSWCPFGGAASIFAAASAMGAGTAA